MAASSACAWLTRAPPSAWSAACSASTSSSRHRSSAISCRRPCGATPTPTAAQSVPTWTLPFLGIFIPSSAIILLVARTHGNALETRRAAAGLCLAVALGFAVTNFIKNGVGAFRPPGFVARCWPDGEITWAAHGAPTARPARASRRDGRPKIIAPAATPPCPLRAELRVRVRRGPARRVFSTAREGTEVGVGVARGGCVGASRARRRGQHQSHAGLLASSRGCRVGRDHRHLVRGSRVGAETTRLGGGRRRRGSATRDKDGDDGFESTRWRPARWVGDGRRPVG